MNQIELLYEVPVPCANSISEKICIQPKAFSIQHSAFMLSVNQAMGFFGHRNLLSEWWDHCVFLHTDRRAGKGEVETHFRYMW